ncbi:MAG: iron uptake system protein EfeO [Micropruina sp.]
MNSRLLATTALLGVASLGLSACTDNAAPASVNDPRRLTVSATDTACQLSASTAPSGTVTFAVTNNGSLVTEFYLLGPDGLRILAEVENIGPGLTRELVLTASAGKVFAACKPGMQGAGIRQEFTVTDSGEVAPTGDEAAMIALAAEQYRLYVRAQVEELLTATTSFADLVKAGSDDEARDLYPEARVFWERVEIVAESFGDLDPRMDAREADLEPGQAFTGWHRLEKDLWPARAGEYTPLTAAQRATIADQLVADTQELYNRTRELTYTASDIANGAKSLLDEVATGKVTGEEEYFSRTDLWDFQANVDGARVAWEGLRPLLQTKDAALGGRIAREFENVQALLDAQRKGDGFVTYDTLTAEQIKAMADAVNALSEPLSKLAAAVLA